MLQLIRGCVETSKPTTHGDPTYIVDDIVHCVANMPGGVPRTSTFALNQATLPYLIKLANNGYQKALGEDKNFLAGLNICKGEVTIKLLQIHSVITLYLHLRRYKFNEKI